MEHTIAKTEVSSPEDDSSTLAFSMAVFPWYGETVAADLYFGSNGYISLNQSDTTYSADSKGDEDANAEVGRAGAGAGGVVASGVMRVPPTRNAFGLGSWN